MHFESDSARCNSYSTQVRRERQKDLYSVLGVTPHSTQSQIKTAYYELSKKYHPGRQCGPR